MSVAENEFRSLKEFGVTVTSVPGTDEYRTSNREPDCPGKDLVGSRRSRPRDGLASRAGCYKRRGVGQVAKREQNGRGESKRLLAGFALSKSST